jgi:hypothetical protein
VARATGIGVITMSIIAMSIVPATTPMGILMIPSLGFHAYLFARSMKLRRVLSSYEVAEPKKGRIIRKKPEMIDTTDRNILGYNVINNIGGILAFGAMLLFPQAPFPRSTQR